MKPILFDLTETEFTSNGLGRLSDALSCIITEERNGAYELEMTYPIDGIHFSDIAHSRIIYAQPADGKSKQPFRIYYISKPIDGISEIKAEHISYQLSHIPLKPFEASSVGEALAGLKVNAAEACPFTFWTDKTTVASFKVTAPESIRAKLGGEEGSILDAYGGEYEFDGYTVKLHNARGQNRNVTLRYGKNITDIHQEENIANTYTGVMPYWAGASENSEEEEIVCLPEYVIHSANASNFPYQRTIALDLSGEFEEKPTVEQLRTRARAYMTANAIGTPQVAIEVSFLPLWQTEEYKDIAVLERVYLCDTVSVYFPKLDISATAKVIKTEYDVLNERYNTIELGDAKSSFAQAVQQDISGAVVKAVQKAPSTTDLQKAVNKATKLITGGLGGYVIIKQNADGQPEEILVMDTDDTSTAENVIRINKNGIGFSTTGYNGPFNTAWTIDGGFVADYITSGVLNAALITAGYLSADRIQGGTLTMGGKNNGNGVIRILDAGGNEIGRIDNTGAALKGDIELESDGVSTYQSTLDVPIVNTQTHSLFYANLPAFIQSYTGLGATKKTMKKMVSVRGSSVIDATFSLGNGYNFNNQRICLFDLDELEPSSLASIDSYFCESIKENEYDLSLRVGGELIACISLSSSSIQIVSRSDEIYITSSRQEVNERQIAFTSSSSKRYKKRISKKIDKKLDPHKLYELELKQFKYKKGHKLQYRDMEDLTIPGFIAEDVAEIYPAAVIHDAEGNIESWDERRILPGMLKLIQEQKEMIDDLTERVAALERVVSDGK